MSTRSSSDGRSPSDGTSPDPTRTWLATPPTSEDPSSPNSTLSTSATTSTPSPPNTANPQQRVTIGDAVSNIKPADFLKVHQSPCSQQGFLTGIGTGATVGILRWVFGLPIPRAANWAVGTGALGALLQYEYCQYQRRHNV